MAYCSCVPPIGWNCGAPSYCTLSLACLRSTVAVCGMLLGISASFDSGVFRIDASAPLFGLSGGILAKSAGNLAGVTYVHGPLLPGAVNQRPDTSTYHALLLAPSTITSAPVLSM